MAELSTAAWVHRELAGLPPAGRALLFALYQRKDDWRSAAIVVPDGFTLKAVDYDLQMTPPFKPHDVSTPGITLTVDEAWYGRRMFLVRGDGPITPTSPATDGLVAMSHAWVASSPETRPYTWLPNGWPTGTFPLAITRAAVGAWAPYFRICIRVAIGDPHIERLTGEPLGPDEPVPPDVSPDDPIFGRRAIVLAGRLLAVRLDLAPVSTLARLTPSEPDDVLNESEPLFTALNAWANEPLGTQAARAPLDAGRPSDPGAVDLTALAAAAHAAQLKGNMAAVVSDIIGAGGSIGIPALELKFEWDTKDNWNSTKKRVNDKLRPLGWEIYQFDNKACARRI